MEFNLLTEPWIQVRTIQGERKLVSLRACFEQAGTLAKVEYDSPLAVASVYRLLTAILHRSYGKLNDESWSELLEQGNFGETVNTYLNNVSDCFDLYHKEKPFFQTAGFSKDEPTNVKKLSPHFATANNKTLFTHTSDSQTFSLPAEQAAVLLLVCQYFSLGGGVAGTSNLGKHSNFTNSPLIGGAFVWTKGQNLFQSLVFNMFDLDGVVDTERFEPEQDKAIWEQETPEKFANVRSVLGIADYLTWSSRHIRFIPNSDGSVSQMYFAQGYANPAEIKREPFFAYRFKKDGEKAPVRLSFGRSLWRDSMSLINTTQQDVNVKKLFDLRPCNIRRVNAELSDIQEVLGDNYTVQCDVIALDNDKANPKGWFHESLPINLHYFAENNQQNTELMSYLARAIQYAELKALGLRASIRVFASELMVEGCKTEEITKLVDGTHYEAHYWPKLNELFTNLYKGIIEDPEEAISLWFKKVVSAAYQTFEQVTFNYIGSGEKSYQAYAKARLKLQQELTGYKNLKHQEEQVKEVKDFIDYLEKLNSNKYKNTAALAHLRKSLSDEPTAWLGAFPYLSDQLPAKQYASSKAKPQQLIEWEQRVYVLVAGLFASHLIHRASRKSLGMSCAQLKEQPSDKLTSIDLRFKTLLECEKEQLPALMRSLFQMLKGKNIAVDYGKLLTDLLSWHKPEKTTQLNWATDFWAVHQSLTEKPSDDTKN